MKKLVVLFLLLCASNAFADWSYKTRTINGVVHHSYSDSITLSDEQQKKLSQGSDTIKAAIPELVGISVSGGIVVVEFTKQLSQAELDSVRNTLTSFAPVDYKYEAAKKKIKGTNPNNLNSVPELRAAVKDILDVLGIEYKTN